MAEEKLTEERVRSLVQETVQEYLTARVDDVDEIRKSPAGRILILETEIKNISKKVDRLDEKVETFREELKEEISGTRTELKEKIAVTSSESKKEIGSLRLELKNEIGSLRLELKKEIESSKNLSLVLFIAILGLIGSIFVKIFFFM